MLQSCVGDAIPGVRAIAARALGTMVASMGLQTFPKLRNWLLTSMINKDNSSPLRSGAARSLVEVLIACRLNKEISSSKSNLTEDDPFMDYVNDKLLPLQKSESPETREGELFFYQFSLF